METRRHGKHLVAGLAMLCAAAGVMAAHAAEEFESERTLNVQDLLSEEERKGPYHEVADEVRTVGYMAQFIIKSEYGEFQAGSREMARVRIAEIGSIAALVELSSSEMFADALAKAAVGKVETAKKVVENPEAAAKGVRRGLKGLFGKAKRAAAEAAEKAKEEEAEAGGGDESSSSDAATKVAKDSTGASKAKRKLAASVKADPYSTNERLQRELERLANAAAAGGLAGSMGLSIPGLNTLSMAGQLAWSVPPADLRKRNQESLSAMGVGEPVMKKLFANDAYSPSIETALVLALEGLDGVEDRASLVERAAEAENEVEARFYWNSVRLLAGAHSSGNRLVRATALRRAPAAFAADDTFVVAAAIDHLVWTRELAEAARQPGSGAGNRQLLLTGSVSSRARAELQKSGWSVRDSIRLARAIDEKVPQQKPAEKQ